MLGKLILSLIVGLMTLVHPLQAEIDSVPSSIDQVTAVDENHEPVKVQILSDESSIKEGRPFWVAVRFDMDEGWHLYWKNPGDAGAPPQVEWNLPKGFQVTNLQWPAPQHFVLNEFSSLGYENQLTLLAQVIPPAHLSTNEVTLSAEIQWVACKNECIPGMPSVSLTLPVKNEKPQLNEQNTQIFKAARRELPRLLGPIAIEAHDKELVLRFDSPVNISSLQKAAFFSEEQGLVDLSSGQTLTLSGNQYALTVPLLKEWNSKEQPLTGLLVFSKPGEPEKNGAAFEVKVPAEALTINHIAGNNQSKEILTQTTAKRLMNNAFEKAAIQDPESQGGSSSTMGIGIAILAAFGGGLLLNLMPCVLPVLSIKVLGVVQAAGDSKRERYKQGFAYVLGVMLSFWVLAGLLLILRASGEELGWGFQLQEPIFVGVLACLMFVMGLNLYGVFEWGTSFAKLQGTHSTRSAVLESFWGGVLATIIATPCTGPFLGAALGFAMALPPLGSFAIFSVMGLGMAIPFLLLTISPPLLKLLPKPGNWMVVFKQLMGFLLMASVLWLLWVWEAQTDFSAVMQLLAALLVLSIGAWCYGQWGQLIHPLKSRLIAATTAITAVAIAFSLIYNAANSQGTLSNDSLALKSGKVQLSDKTGVNLTWEAFSVERLQELRSKGVPVFIDFTAKWCLICQTNKVVLHSDAVNKAFDQAGVVRMRADWTKKDPEITRMLKEFHRSGVPLYVLYGPGGSSPKIFPETLTPDMLIDAVSGNVS